MTRAASGRWNDAPKWTRHLADRSWSAHADVSGSRAIYPSRPIRVIISVSAGGTGDIITRAIGEQLSKRLGQPFVLEARPGGNQTIAGRACAEAPPDGYTVCVLSGETSARTNSC